MQHGRPTREALNVTAKMAVLRCRHTGQCHYILPASKVAGGQVKLVSKRRKATCLAAIVLILTGTWCAQAKTAQATLPADQALAQARQVYLERGGREALPLFERALGLYRAAGDRRGEAVTLDGIGNCYESLSDYPRAIETLERALALKQQLGARLEIAKTLSNLGLVYWDTGDYSKAIEHFTKALDVARELKDGRVEGAIENNLGLVYGEMGDYSRSLESHRRSVELFRSVHNAQGESEALGNIGRVHYSLGQFREAARYYQQALEIDERRKLKRAASIDLGDLALCHLALGEAEPALGVFDRAIRLAREGGYAKEEADWHKGKGSTLLSLGKVDLARDQFEQARQVYERVGLKRELIEALNDEGTLYAELGDLASAEKYFRQALQLSRSINHPAGVTANLLSLGDLEWRRQRFGQAATLYREAYERAREAHEQDSLATGLIALALTLRDQGKFKEAIPDAQQAYDIAHSTGARLTEARALYALGELTRMSGDARKALEYYGEGVTIARSAGDTELGWQIAFGRGQAPEALGRDADAVAAYHQAVVIIEGVRNQLREARFRAGYIVDKSQVYVALVRLLLKMGKAGEAFIYSEKLRAQSYLSLLDRNPFSPPNKKEAELRARIRELQRSIVEETGKPASERRGGKLMAFAAGLVEAEREYQALIDDRRISDSNLAAARALAVPSPLSVERSLPPHSALLEYVVGHDFLAIFVVKKTGVETKRVAVRDADLNAKIELFRDLVEKQETTEWAKPAESLYDLLIQPIEQAGWLQGVTRLYVVPHEVLYYLPFAALPKPGSEGRHFLVEDYVLAYLPAASALVYGSRAADSARSVFALAPARAHLRFTQQEAETVGGFYPAPRRLVLTGVQATESAFKAQAEKFATIHLATHGYLDKLNPMFSGVELEPDAKEDGRLEVHEILRLRLRARLVTLSACETALGSGYFSEVPPGDDFVGLTRAFLTAGSSEVLASLWEVNDQSTLELMRRFYDNLQKSGEAVALREAQLAMLNEGGRYAHPYYWAPFVLMGSKK